jgi:maleate isomerase
MMTRRTVIASGASALFSTTLLSRVQASTPVWQSGERPSPARTGTTSPGPLSGRPVFMPNMSEPPIPAIAPSGPVLNGEPTTAFDVANLSSGHPDACSHRRRFGLLIPATNTTMESELWNIVVRNREHGLDGVGLHTSPVLTPKPEVGSPEGIEQYRRHFLSGVASAVSSAMLAGPQYLILGMSLEHIISGIEPIRATADQLMQGSALSWATWHDASKAALQRFGARRIGLVTPFERSGNESAARMFRDMGFEVVSTFGFACANAQHIAHIPNEAKERAVLELLATKANRLDAVVQCGTNMAMTAVAEKLESRIGMPIVGINATLLWYALRESGIQTPVQHAGRLLREF